MKPPRLVKIRSEDSDFQHIESLRRNRLKRHQSGEFFVEGVRAIAQAIDQRWEISALAFSREKRLSDWAESALQRADARVHYEMPLALMVKLSQKEAASELLALVRMPPDDLRRIPISALPLVVVLDRPANPGNIGSTIRSCEAFGVDGLVITGHSADLYDPEIIRATTGSFFSLPAIRLASQADLLPWLQELRSRLGALQVVGTSARAEGSIQQHNFAMPTILVIGNEQHGLSQNYRSLCDALVKIPMAGSASSLNAACAASIFLYEIARQRSLAGAA